MMLILKLNLGILCELNVKFACQGVNLGSILVVYFCQTSQVFSDYAWQMPKCVSDEGVRRNVKLGSNLCFSGDAM